MNDMKKMRELLAAFGYIPKMFGLIYRTDKRYLYYLLCETLCFAVISYPSMFLVKYAFDAMETGKPFSQFAIVCVALILFQLGISLTKSLFNSIRPARTSLVVGRLYNEFHRKSMEMDYELLAEKEIQELQAFAGNFIRWQLGRTVWNFVSLFSSLIAFVISCVLLINISFLLIIAVIMGLLLDSALSMKFIALNFKLKERIMKIDRYIRYYEETAASDTAAKDLRIFDMGSKVISRIEGCNSAKFRLERKRKLYSDIQGLLSILNSHGSDFAIYAVLGFFALRGKMSLGDISLAIGNIALFRQYFGRISSTLVGYADTAKYIEYYNRFVSLESKFRKTGTKPVTISKSDDFEIEFRDVSFKYPGQTDYVLRHFDLKIKSGEKVSIIGESGAGKSTFVKLLMRLYDPAEGQILLNGTDIKHFNYDEYLAVFAPIFQDFKLFAFTVGENISAFENCRIEDVKTAAEKSGIDKRIEELPVKYDTYLTKLFDDTGVEFSGGEQQKIALARTYFKTNALIMILDEPTSALDPRAEYEVYKEFNDLIGNNTAFFISHRLSSSKFCDKIVVVRDKRVCEFGTHDELMNVNGYYAELYGMQAGYYI